MTCNITEIHFPCKTIKRLHNSSRRDDVLCTYFEETHYVVQIERKIIIGEASWQTLMNGNKSSYNDFSF